MIVKLYNNPMVILKPLDEDDACDPVGVSIDNGSTIVLTQEDREVCIDLAIVDEVILALKKMKEFHADKEATRKALGKK